MGWGGGLQELSFRFTPLCKSPGKIFGELPSKARSPSIFIPVSLASCGTPSPRPTLKALAGAGSVKERLQNLDFKDLRGQNLDGKGLRASVAVVVQTASALTIIGLFSEGGKVRYHTGPVNLRFVFHFSRRRRGTGHSGSRHSEIAVQEFLAEYAREAGSIEGFTKRGVGRDKDGPVHCKLSLDQIMIVGLCCFGELVG